uniref:RING-type domain-containing protein n=1 Tax=Rhabditophanes sp. KR3021 TaxID=114890 RepID=A0AC35TVA3_9BILA
MKRNLQGIATTITISNNGSCSSQAIVPGANIRGQSESFRMSIDILRCPICRDHYKEPYQMKCGHSFCHYCLKKQIETAKECPICKGSILEIAEAFPNLILGKIVDSIERKPKIMYESEFMSVNNKYAALYHDEEMAAFKEYEYNKALKAENDMKLKVLLKYNFFVELIKIRSYENNIKSSEMLMAINDRDKLISQLIKTSISGNKIVETSLARETNGSPLSKRAHLQVAGEQGVRVPDNHNMSLSNADSLLAVHENQLDNDTKMSASMMKRVEKMRIHMNGLSAAYFTQYRGPYNKNDLANVRRPTANDFDEMLDGVTKYSKLKVLTTLAYREDVMGGLGIVSSMEFDADGNNFAVGGITSKIKIYRFNDLLSRPNGQQVAVGHLDCKAKTTHVAYNPFHKSLLAASDYEGCVTIWDTANCKVVKAYREHTKRCWDVKFNKQDPTLFASCSDDTTVRLWSLGCRKSVSIITTQGNVCSVEFNPNDKNLLLLGSAEHSVYLYDIRNPSTAVHTFMGHKRTIASVRHLSDREFVSSAVDSSLRVWDIQTGQLIQVLKGHQNEKHFVGLSTNKKHIVSGSEDGKLYVYNYKFPDPISTFDIGAVTANVLPGTESRSQYDPYESYVTSVCWKKYLIRIKSSIHQFVLFVMENVLAIKDKVINQLVVTYKGVSCQCDTLIPRTTIQYNKLKVRLEETYKLALDNEMLEIGHLYRTVIYANENEFEAHKNASVEMYLGLSVILIAMTLGNILGASSLAMPLDYIFSPSIELLLILAIPLAVFLQSCEDPCYDEIARTKELFGSALISSVLVGNLFGRGVVSQYPSAVFVFLIILILMIDKDGSKFTPNTIIGSNSFKLVGIASCISVIVMALLVTLTFKSMLLFICLVFITYLHMTYANVHITTKNIPIGLIQFAYIFAYILMELTISYILMIN